MQLSINRSAKKQGQKTQSSLNTLVVLLYFSLYLCIGISLLIKQPFGNPPDEINRYLIPSYIAQHLTLPNGYDPSIRIPGYGFSYAFQPILPYMIQGYACAFVKLFTDSATILLYTARSVDLFFGLVMAFFVLLLSRKWFSDVRIQYLFAFLVTFLPQSIFIHTYVNTDSCCMMSIAIILYGLTIGLEKNFSISSCICLAVGIILCALSYYNAYGFILSAILLFIASFIRKEEKNLTFLWKPFLKKGILISIIVLLGIGWWFVRSYLLYDGDILGLRTRDACASLYAIPEFHPDTRFTYEKQGYTLLGMLYKTDFLNLSTLSFIGVYGPMTIVTSIWIYRFYKLLFFLGIICCIVLSAKNAQTDTLCKNRGALQVFYHTNMLFCILLPCFLSAYYSYTTDYQPQGRYILPILIPFCYYCVRGIEKASSLAVGFLTGKKPAKHAVYNRMFTGLCALLILFIIVSLCVTVYGYAFPYYVAHPTY